MSNPSHNSSNHSLISFRSSNGSISVDSIASSRLGVWPADSLASTLFGKSFGTLLPNNSWNQTSSATSLKQANSSATSDLNQIKPFDWDPVSASNLRSTPQLRARMLSRMYYGKKPVSAGLGDGAAVDDESFHSMQANPFCADENTDTANR